MAQELVDEVEGYPYFIQLWGSELWDAADLAGVDRLTKGLLDEARPEIYQRLDRDFYEPQVSTLTPAEQDVLPGLCLLSLPAASRRRPRPGVRQDPGNVNVLLGRLTEAGALYRIRKGEYEYTAPKFRDFLLRR